jgi:HSP20 family molecular chaperone IbpA
MSDRILFGQIRLDRMQSLHERSATREGARFRPPTDVFETEDAIVVTIEVAGLNDDELEITLSESERLLTVVGRRQSLGAELNRITFHRVEIPYGEFAVDVPVPWPLQGSEAASAYYHNGFLVVTLPKSQPRQVAIRMSS